MLEVGLMEMNPEVEADDATPDVLCPPIKIILSNDIPYVWTAVEWKSLRRDHRICGLLDGACPGLGSVASLPVRLSLIEAQYLVKHGKAKSFHVPAFSDLNTIVSKEDVKNLKEKRVVEQLEAHRQKRKLEIESMVDKIIEGKKRRGRGLVPDRDTVIQEEIGKVGLPYELTQIDLEDPWIKDCEYVPCDIPKVKGLKEKLMFRVFEDFILKRKYYITSGLKFGGDFLAYPNDPHKVHSEFIILCHDTSDSPMPLAVESLIKLARKVRKILLIATLDEERDVVKYRKMNKLCLSNTDNNDDMQHRKRIRTRRGGKKSSRHKKQ